MRLLAENESVKQQSTIAAGTGGFDVRVNGHTHLQGGAVASKAHSHYNYFATQTLTHQDVLNRDVVSGKSWSVSVNVSASPQGTAGVAGSSVGFARLDTNETFTTRSSVAGGVNLWRPDLQASRMAGMKSVERDPLAAARSEKQTLLNQLQNNEPPKCVGCQIQSTPTPVDGGLAEADSVSTKLQGTNVSASTRPTAIAAPAAETFAPVPVAAALPGTNSTSAAWLKWWSAVTSLQAQIAALDSRISAIDAKVYQGPGTLSTSPSGLHLPLLHTFDKTKATQELKDGVAVTAAFGKAAYRTAGDFATAKETELRNACADKEKCAEADKWKDGGVYRTALHMAIGGMAFGTAGATGNLAGSLALNAMEKVLADLKITDASAVNLLKNLVVTVAGAAAGGTTGAAAAFNADANNRQLHLHETRWIGSKAAQLAAHLSAALGRPVSEPEAMYWATMAAESAVDTRAQSAVQLRIGLSTSEEAQLYKAANQYLSANVVGQTFVDQQGVTQRFFFAAPEDRHFNTFKYAEFRNSAEYREFMWANSGRNLLPDAPTASDLSLYTERQSVLLRETGVDLALAAIGGGLNYAGVRLLNRHSPPRTSLTLARQEIALPDLDKLVTEHSRNKPGGGGHTGLDLTREAALKAVQETQPAGTRAVVAGQGVAGPDVTFVRVSDGAAVETVQLKTASNPNKFEQAIREDLAKPIAPDGGSRNIVIIYPDATDVARLIGKLQNNFQPIATAGRSILVLDPMGRVIIPLQPFPKKP